VGLFFQRTQGCGCAFRNKPKAEFNARNEANEGKHGMGKEDLHDWSDCGDTAEDCEFEDGWDLSQTEFSAEDWTEKQRGQGGDKEIACCCGVLRTKEQKQKPVHARSCGSRVRHGLRNGCQ
jgi:hypothetical protein